MSATVMHPSTIAVPADYLEDFRSAVIAEIRSDSEAVQAADQKLVAMHEAEDLKEIRLADRNSAVSMLRQSTDLLGQLSDATEDTEVTGNPGALVHVLDEMCRLLTVRLADRMEYTPLDLPAVQDLADRLVWAVTANERIDEPREPQPVSARTLDAERGAG